MKRFLITGTSRGLGLEFTRQILARGDHVFAGARHPEMSRELQKLASRNLDRLTLLELDVTNHASIEDTYQQVVNVTDWLDVLINNAGIFDIRKEGEHDPKLGTVKAENMLDVFRVNTAAPLMIVQRFLPLLKVGENPKIINISSVMGSISQKNMGGYYNYSASKAALNMVTRILAQDVKPFRIIVVALHPGWVKTDLGGPNAPMNPKESVKGMLKVVDGLTPSDTGKFLQYNGQEVAW